MGIDWKAAEKYLLGYGDSWSTGIDDIDKTWGQLPKSLFWIHCTKNENYAFLDRIRNSVNSEISCAIVKNVNDLPEEDYDLVLIPNGAVCRPKGVDMYFERGLCAKLKGYSLQHNCSVFLQYEVKTRLTLDNVMGLPLGFEWNSDMLTTEEGTTNGLLIRNLKNRCLETFRPFYF